MAVSSQVIVPADFISNRGTFIIATLPFDLINWEMMYSSNFSVSSQENKSP